LPVADHVEPTSGSGHGDVKKLDKAVAIAGSRPFDLWFTGPAERHTGAHVVKVSNNPYGGTARTLGSRPVSTSDGSG
jgi:hypothetical protein